MRTLIHIAIVHSLADFGSLTEQVKQNFQRQFGSQKWNKHLDDVEQFWNQVHNEILQLNLNWPRVRLYQDGLPVCGRELEIVSQVAASGSKNHRLLLELIHRGTHLMGTEDPTLLMEEYARAKASLSGKGAAPADSERSGASGSVDDLLRKRDQFIATTINQTLREGETGLLFLGMTHSALQFLAPDIQVRSLVTVGPPRENDGA